MSNRTIEDRTLSRSTDWDDTRAEARGGSELILFKFSPVCGLSEVAEEQLERWLETLPPDAPVKLARVDVIGARPTSQHIAADVAVRHESPQIIWIDREGNLVYHASHRAITVDALSDEFARAGREGSGRALIAAGRV